MNITKTLKTMAVVTSTLLFGAVGAQAAPVNFNGLLQNGVVFGSGNANGSFTGVNQNGVELALRGKQRYDLAGNPQNIFNYDGDRTYSFDPANSNAPANRSIWNFEFSIDVTNTAGGTFAASNYDFLLGVDVDPTAGVTFAGSPSGFDPLSIFGDNAGGPGVAQNSQNLGFGYTVLNPQLEGIYTISLMAMDGTAQAFSTSIDIVVGPAAVPLPAGGFLLLAGLAGFAGLHRRKKRAA